MSSNVIPYPRRHLEPEALGARLLAGLAAVEEFADLIRLRAALEEAALLPEAPERVLRAKALLDARIERLLAEAAAAAHAQAYR